LAKAHQNTNIDPLAISTLRATIMLTRCPGLKSRRVSTAEKSEQFSSFRERAIRSGKNQAGLRKRFELSQAANLIAGLPVLFILVALLFVPILSLITATAPVNRNLLLLGCYFLWAALLGAFGGIAFLSMNALSIQKDITFDLANKSLLAVRIVLGALVGFFLSMPFGFYSFVAFLGVNRTRNPHGWCRKLQLCVCATSAAVRLGLQHLAGDSYYEQVCRKHHRFIWRPPRLRRQLSKNRVARCLLQLSFSNGLVSAVEHCSCRAK
jgi:hypothetical protein